MSYWADGACTAIPSHNVIGDIKGGLVASTTCFAFSVANGALIYSGAGATAGLLAFGLSAGFVTTAVTSLLLGLTSTFKPVIGTANATMGAPFGALVITAAPTFAALPPRDAAATTLALIAVTTVVAGLALVFLGLARLGQIVRFIPYPVVAGFMGVTGTLLVFGSVRLGTGIRLAWTELPRFEEKNTAILLALTLGFAATVSLVTRRFKHPLVLPGLLVAAILVSNAATYASGYSADTPSVPGLFLAPRLLPAPVSLATAPLHVQWALIPPLLSSIAAYGLLVVLATLLTTTGLETALNVDADTNRELRSQGIACVISSLCGGFVGNPSVGATMAGVATGARGRVAGITNALVMVVAWLFLLPLLAYVPRFVIAGFLAHIGVWIMMTWCVATRTKMPRGEWIVVIGIVAVTVWAGMVPAILSGLIAGCILFAIDVSRISVLRREYGLDERSSKVVRAREDLAILAREGDRIRFFELGGMLFFGSAYQVLSRVRNRLELGPSTVVLDLTAVTGCDSSAAAVIARMRKLLKREAIGFAIVCGDPMIVGLLRTSGSLDPLDAVYSFLAQALEAAEVALLADIGGIGLSDKTLRTWVGEAFGGEANAASLIGNLRCEEHAPGDYLCREGEPTDTLLFIERGRVVVLVGKPPGERCVRVFGPHTIAGEHGFVLGLPRTASLKVEEAVRVWVLDRTVFAALEESQPELVIALLRNIVRLQSERLAFATRQAAALG